MKCLPAHAGVRQEGIDLLGMYRHSGQPGVFGGTDGGKAAEEDEREKARRADPCEHDILLTRLAMRSCRRSVPLTADAPAAQKRRWHGSRAAGGPPQSGR